MLSVKILSSILGVTWITCMLAFFIGCRPVSDYWRVLPSAPDCAVSVKLIRRLCMVADDAHRKQCVALHLVLIDLIFGR